MGNSRILNRWKGYSTSDCACKYCLYFRGIKHGCSLEACCCAAERAEAREREQAVREAAKKRKGAS
jgi:hypothetical protein